MAIITKAWGDKAYLEELTITYRGPKTTLYVCWGIQKAAGANYDNGAGLLAEAYGWGAVDVPECLSAKDIALTLTDCYVNITEAMGEQKDREAWIWVTADSVSLTQTDFVSPLDIDNDVISIMGPSVSKISDAKTWA